MFKPNNQGERSLTQELYEFFVQRGNQPVRVVDLKRHIANNFPEGRKYRRPQLGTAIQQLLIRNLITRTAWGTYVITPSVETEEAIAVEPSSTISSNEITDLTIRSYDRDGEPGLLELVRQCFLSQPNRFMKFIDVKKYIDKHASLDVRKKTLYWYVNLLVDRNVIMRVRWGVYTLHPSLKSTDMDQLEGKIRITGKILKTIDKSSLQDYLDSIGIREINIEVDLDNG